MRRVRQLCPRDVARIVAGALPPHHGQRLLFELERRGLLEPTAVVPFDLLDGPACPAAFRGPQRETVRLALFGLPGQGLAWRDKHRHDVYQRFCAEIMSRAVDTASLQAAASRILSHPDVCADSLLGSMLRSFIGEREAALRAARVTPEEEQRRRDQASKLHSGFSGRHPSEFPSKREITERLGRFQREFDNCLAQFEETLALRALEKIREIRQKYPVHVPAGDLQTAEEQYDRLLKRAGAYRRQIKDLALRGAAAAREGDPETANWVLKRLDAIHALLPNLLTQEDLRRLREGIGRCGEEHETEEAIHELVERKKEVAGQIKRLAGTIHRFHQISGKVPPDDPAYRRTEANYRRAVEEIRHLDTEWLSGLVIELETLLRDLEDPTGVMQNKLDHFIDNVRSALNRLCLEIRAHQRNRTRGNNRRDGGQDEDDPRSQTA
jgi:hypothetical protein